MKIVKTLCIIALLFTAVNCKNAPKESASNSSTNLIGNYVSNHFDKRDEGYDWVAVMVKESKNGNLNIKVRSRADKKNETCTFDAEATKRNAHTYETVYDNKTIVFQFTKNQITISTQNPQDIDLLYYFCSGGASLAGTYQKTNEKINL